MISSLFHIHKLPLWLVMLSEMSLKNLLCSETPRFIYKINLISLSLSPFSSHCHLMFSSRLTCLSHFSAPTKVLPLSDWSSPDAHGAMGPAKSTPITSNGVLPSVRSMGRSPGGGVAIAWNCLQPEHALRTCFTSALKRGTQYSSRTLVMVRASPPCSV